MDSKPTLSFSHNIKPSRLQLSELLFPKSFITDTIIPQINRDIKGSLFLYGEYLLWLGLWFLMAMLGSPSRYNFWSIREINPFNGVPLRFLCFMSPTQFEEILWCIWYTNQDPSGYKDPCHKVCQMIQTWNDNMKANFKSRWVTCLDESMSL